MATRFRLPASGSAAVSPAFQSYTHAMTTRRPLPTTDASTLTTDVLAPDGADHLVAGDVGYCQFVSDPLPAGMTFTSGDAMTLAIQGLESNAGNNLFVQLYVAVVSSDGATVRRILRTKVNDGTELGTALASRVHSTTQSGATYTTVADDRLVVEISAQGLPVAAGGVQGHNASFRVGGSGASDIAADAETSTTVNPWFEVTPNIPVDTTAPILSAQTVDTPTADGGTPKVTTDEANGTAYMVVVPDGDSPSVAQIKAGQNSSGAAALANQNQAVTATGVQTFSTVTGLTSNTAYDVWFVHRDAAGNDSTAVKADFSTLITFNDVRQAIIDGIDSAQAEAAGWDAQRANIPVTAVVRTSATVVTITLPVLPGYNITAQEILTATVPASALVSGGPIVATPTIPISSGVAGYTLTAETGAFTVVGTSATLRVSRRIAADAGAMTIAGTAAIVKRGLRVSAQSGAIAVAGQTAALRTTRRVAAVSGSVVVAGVAATVRTGRRVVADSGSVLITGTAASFIKTGNKTLAADAGAFVVTGTSATLRATRRLVAASGSVSIVGTPATLKYGHRVIAQPGAVLVTGTVASLRITRRLTASSGAVTVNGIAASLRAARRLIAQAGAVLISGQDVNFAVGGNKVLTATSGAFLITGTPAGLRVGRRVAGAGGAFVVVGTSARLAKTSRVLATSGAFLVSGSAASVSYGHRLSAQSGAFLINGISARLAVGRVIQAESGSFVVFGPEAGLLRGGLSIGFIELVASFEPTAEIPASFETSIGLMGSYEPTITLAASIDVD